MRSSLFPSLLRAHTASTLLRRSFSAAATRLVADFSFPEDEHPDEALQPPKPPESQEPTSSTSLDPSPPQLQTTEPSQSPPKPQSRVDQPLIYPSPPSAPNHHDLPTFLEYASRTNLDPETSVYVGTLFEYTTCAALARYGFSLRRVGGVSDGGVDLLGTFSPPGVRKHASVPNLKVIAQCKAVRKPGPHLVRELEGAFASAPVGWRGSSGVLGLLVTGRPATRGIREALGRSSWPMAFVMCTKEGRVLQMLWNRRAEEEGLEGLGVTTRYYREEGGQEGKEVVLTWRGRNLPLAELGEGKS
ncbi:uncharacterized protein CTHT_0029540 [Thermochaetoides thermophila DSM 1495]|uniref:Required for respiratory growth protein 7, mitochondrial n=1 Tax=Chaetomium thermophilum (strain DSM 1495 / CBS 144.50 / IMI 039719) TaxID=759272 RepID=G0S8D9_CHATD|nr:hypothetical protein CTHT_0029540 [Thermochaetoides thermophila DSM 1495]EGS21113.1 hypothetical protein CTHT_0029540 [Thermochaetoides thermophila DSM 1495]